MDSRFGELSAVELRNLVLDETRKFILSLQFGSGLSDLEEIREKIKVLSDVLAVKEKDELKLNAEEKYPQSKINVQPQ
ncbi:hypothetical protein A4D02_35240 [Niastella koreensis]|uniref:Uncharacterized protein n=2 Tax=Niastella koreensis TaxID=354356 RepID=G8TBS1_NIAKG|nr:hypothetical protein [Niastella koreensis]AEV98203.1 hypothetical protein Niako_1844 [Niastella koreensis GR20-10]OQP44313.1 hypothetical protein A4D02_35240 [Niastella koreensis]